MLHSSFLNINPSVLSWFFKVWTFHDLYFLDFTIWFLTWLNQARIQQTWFLTLTQMLSNHAFGLVPLSVYWDYTSIFWSIACLICLICSVLCKVVLEVVAAIDMWKLIVWHIEKFCFDVICSLSMNWMRRGRGLCLAEVLMGLSMRLVILTHRSGLPSRKFQRRIQSVFRFFIGGSHINITLWTEASQKSIILC